jgi:hypothetical protein
VQKIKYISVKIHKNLKKVSKSQGRGSKSPCPAKKYALLSFAGS